MKHLLLIEDDSGRRTVELHTASSSIGRDPRNSIVINSREVSRQHAILLRLSHPDEADHQFRIIDGNFQGMPSKNGLFINGRQRTSHNLCHGDAIMFGARVDARYFAIEESSDVDWLLSGADEAADYMQTLVSTPIEPASTELAIESTIDGSSIARLASFPELFPHPIIEISLKGKLTYLNPAAVEQFPKIQLQKLEHPLLVGVIDAVKTTQQEQFRREITVGDRVNSPVRIFEQALNYIPQSDLIRIYLLDITSRKQAEDTLKALHSQLETEVEQRTQQFNEATNRLKQEEKALLASYATNRALLNAIPDPMFRIDCEGNFVNFKSPKHHTLPFAPESCLHHNLSEILPLPAAKLMQQQISKALETTDIQIIEFQLPRRDSAGSGASERPLDFEARIAVSAPDEVMVIFRDITERKQSEADIRTALQSERELNELKTRFVSMTSHEFRTPLTTILSSAELLEHYSDRWEQAKQLKYLSKIQVATKHMTELLNDVLLINQAEAGKIKFNLQPLVINEFCKDVIEEIQITTTSHQLVLNSSLSDGPLLMDRKLLRHIFTNLLSNAINYSPNGGEILITVVQQNETIVLSVKDSGIGIPEEARETLFESFVRGSNVGSISGTGLGLSIVKQFVDLYEGHIDCQSEVGKGTTFIVTLPILHARELDELDESPLAAGVA
ncbi:MAG: ATP-binding protein [Cyanobacteria bacterium J06634_5]